MVAIIIGILCFNKLKENNILIPENSIRIRIIANSNSIEDQYLKIKIKKDIEKILTEKVKNTKNINEARNNIKNNLYKVENILKKTLVNNNYEINYGINYFPEKELYGVKYEEGNYESLVIKLGEGKGNNWWCVLFPPLCMIDVKIDENNENIEYKSKIVEILNKYK